MYFLAGYPLKGESQIFLNLIRNECTFNLRKAYEELSSNNVKYS
jgi:hypothetical protein